MAQRVIVLDANVRFAYRLHKDARGLLRPQIAEFGSPALIFHLDGSLVYCRATPVVNDDQGPGVPARKYAKEVDKQKRNDDPKRTDYSRTGHSETSTSQDLGSLLGVSQRQVSSQSNHDYTGRRSLTTAEAR